MLPNMDHPEAFGQHPNADITSQIQETRMLFDTLLSLQPQVSTGGGESREDKVGYNIYRNIHVLIGEYSFRVCLIVISMFIGEFFCVHLAC